MKRILFYSENFCSDKTKGGLEVATFRIAKAIKEYGGWEIYNAFRRQSDGKEKSIYNDVIKLGSSDFKKSLADFISRNKIDVVVNMSRFYRHKAISEAAELSGRKPKIIFMQHFAPGSEIKKGTFKSGFHLLKLNPYNPIYWLRSTLYPLLKLSRRRRFSEVYKETYRSSDKVILLSEGYIPDYCEIAGIPDTSKFISIPNIFELEPGEKGNDKGDNNLEIHKNKKKRVLILSRMDEIQKRISLALEVWAKIEKDVDLNDWNLDIVGSGHNTDIVKRLIKKLNLQRAVYHGWKERDSFLGESSILMSTSEYEGLPLSILEAQAYGCVPIAFNSYASLKDVVQPFYNGVVVEKFGDTDDYTNKLKDLMFDQIYREELAGNAQRSTDKFTSEKIAEQWLRILT